jgi:hypothetical protein
MQKCSLYVLKGDIAIADMSRILGTDRLGRRRLAAMCMARSDRSEETEPAQTDSLDMVNPFVECLVTARR